MIIVDKLLTALAMPLGLALCGLIFAVLLIATHWRRLGLALAVVMLATLWITALPVTSRLLLRSLETQYPVLALRDTPTADVIVVLGGGVRPPSAANPFPDLGESSDRVIHAWRLYESGKAPLILLSGGNVFEGERQVPEAETMADLLTSLGVSPKDLILETKSRNTQENAGYSAEIWRSKGFETGLLVTSSYHMPRALTSFRRVGLEVLPTPIDAQSEFIGRPILLELLPDTESLDRSTRAIKEWLGRFVQRVR